jgi:hypothetical protein
VSQSQSKSRHDRQATNGRRQNGSCFPLQSAPPILGHRFLPIDRDDLDMIEAEVVAIQKITSPGIIHAETQRD